MSVADQAPVDLDVHDTGVVYHRSPFRILVRFVRRQPLGAIGFIVVLLIGLAAIFAPYLNTSDPETLTGEVLLSPSADHWFGTNRNGVDLWSRVVYGARPSLIIGVVTVSVGLGGGLIIGLIAGYLGGIVDFTISRIVEFIISFPPIIIGIVVAAALRPGLSSVVIAITIVVMASTQRIIRGAVLQEREAVYVEAARVIGASWPRVILRHILPNTLPLAVVLASALLPTAILFEAGLTFLGFGLAQGQPSWGADLGGTNRVYFTAAPWLAIFPGLALSITILAFNLLGDSLRDVLDPRLRGSGL